MIPEKFLAEGRKSLLLLLFCFSFLIPEAQTTHTLRWEIPLKGSQLYGDRLEQLYLVNDANELLKLDAQGRELARYNQNRLGSIGKVDPFDPFAIMVYYPEFQVLQVLDRSLNLQWSIDFNLKGFFQISLICASNHKQIWAIDQISNRLLQFSTEGEILVESPAFGLLSDVIPTFTDLQAVGTLVYAFEPGQGFWVFDQFGQFVRKIALPGIRDFQLFPEKILYCDTTNWYLYDQQSLLTKTADLPLPTSSFSFLWIPEGWLLLDKDGFKCFDLKRAW